MVKRLGPVGVAALLVVSLVGQAGASQIDINFWTPDTGFTAVRSFDWDEAGSGLPIYAADNPNIPGNQTGTAVKPGDVLSVGQQLTFLYQARLTGMNAPDATAVSLPTLNTNYEYTLVGALTEVVTGFGVIGGQQIATFDITGGTVTMYYDCLATNRPACDGAQANVAAGTGFDDGLAILSGSAVSGSSLFGFTPASGVGQGAATTVIIVEPLAFDTRFFDAPLLHDLDFTTELKFPAGTSTTACFFCNSPADINRTSFNVAAGSLLLKADASNTFTAPAPATLILLGASLAGLGGLRLRRRR